jgi:hypothetical protein
MQAIARHLTESQPGILNEAHTKLLKKILPELKKSELLTTNIPKQLETPNEESNTSETGTVHWDRWNLTALPKQIRHLANYSPIRKRFPASAEKEEEEKEEEGEEEEQFYSDTEDRQPETAYKTAYKEAEKYKTPIRSPIKTRKRALAEKLVTPKAGKRQRVPGRKPNRRKNAAEM